MKKSLILFSLALLLTSVWYSCQKGGISANKQATTTDPLNTVDIGAWHNTVLSTLATANNKTQTFSIVEKTQSYSDLREQIIQILIKKDPATFVESDIRSKAALFDQLNINSQITSSVGSGKSTDQLNTILGYLVTNKLISTALSVEFDKIHKLTNQGADGDVILKAVNSLATQNFAKSDQKYLNTFVSVYNSSYSFWKSRANNPTISISSLQTNKAASNCNTVIIAADTAGALYGLIGGPAWSIIEGGIFSALAANSDACGS